MLHNLCITVFILRNYQKFWNLLFEASPVDLKNIFPQLISDMLIIWWIIWTWTDFGWHQTWVTRTTSQQHAYSQLGLPWIAHNLSDKGSSDESWMADVQGSFDLPFSCCLRILCSFSRFFMLSVYSVAENDFSRLIRMRIWYLRILHGSYSVDLLLRLSV